MFTSGEGGYVAEKAETASGWLFPVGDEVAELGYVDMFTDMFDAMDSARQPVETFYDGYVVNAVMDACYASARSGAWAPVEVEWCGSGTERIGGTRREYMRSDADQGGTAAGRPAQADLEGRGQRGVRRRRRVKLTPASLYPAARVS